MWGPDHVSSAGEILYILLLEPYVRLFRGDFPESALQGLFDFGFPLVILAVFVWIVYRVVRRFAAGKQADRPALTVPARVLSTQTTYSPDTTQDPPKNKVNHYATFALEDGSQRECEISERMYGELSKGDAGLLTFTGFRCIRFVKG